MTQAGLVHDFTRKLVLILLVIVLCHQVVRTQTPTPTPKSAEVLRLEEEKVQAELRKAIAEANKAELDAKFPKPTSSPLAGTTTVNDNALIESQIVAYISLANAANKLVDAIKKNEDLKVGKIAVFSEDEIKLLLSHKVALSQLKVIRDGYCLWISSSLTGSNCPALGIAPAAISGLRIASSLLGSFVDLTSFFRTNVEIKGQLFDIEEAPLVAEVFRAARRSNPDGLPGVEFYYPRVFSPDLNLETEYLILGLLKQVQDLRNTAGRLIADLEKNADDISKAETRVKNTEVTIEQLQAAITDKKSKLSNLLNAYCPRLPAAEREDVSALETRLRRYCPNLPPEQRERVFELANDIKKLDADLFNAKGALVKAQAALKELGEKRKELLEGLQSRVGVNPTNPIHVSDAVAQLKARNEQFDKFVAAIVQAGAGGGPNALTSYIRAENLTQVLLAPADKKSYWLQLKVVKAGGNNRIKTNLIWDIFTGGNRVSHSGGVIVEYILYDTTGQALGSDTITEYVNYIKSDKVRNLPNQKVDDCKPGDGQGTCRKY